MASKLDKFAQSVSPHLEADETVLAAVMAIPDGEAEAGILGTAGAASLGAAGLLFGNEMGDGLGEERRDGTAGAGVASSKGRRVGVVLTGRRVVVFTTSFSGKAKECLGSIPRDGITDVSLGTTSLFGQKMPLVAIATTGGHTAGFGVAKIHKADANRFVDAYRSTSV